jgi:hypothetical protein
LPLQNGYPFWLEASGQLLLQTKGSEMTKTSLAAALASAAVLIAPAAALAQWVPGSEITGQTLQVQTNGISNSVYFGPGGQATITTPGGRVIPATWTAAGGNLCLSTGAAQECWPYASAFQAGQQVTLTSSCNATSSWLANSVNQPPSQAPSGERG